MNWVAEKIAGLAFQGGLKNLWLYLTNKEGKFDWRRTVVAIIVIGGSISFVYICYFLPDALLWISEDKLKGYKWLSGVVDRIRFENAPELLKQQKYHYYILLKSLCETFGFLFISLIGIAYFFWKNHLHERKFCRINSFIDTVGLVGGYKPLTVKGRADADKAIAEAIERSTKIEMMLINGSSIFKHQEESSIFNTLKSSRGKQIKILLLDPFSTYAQDRAKEMFSITGSEGHSAWNRYILDYDNTLTQLRALDSSDQPNYLSFRLHCSRPFFRLIICDNVAFIQTYDRAAHGHLSPIYEVQETKDSLYNLAQDIFNAHWDRGFLLNSKDDVSDLLSLYLAKMHKLPYNDYLQNIDSLKEQIISRYRERLSSAKESSTDALS